jgi:hypothetical protein
MLDVPVAILTVAAVREVAHHDSDTTDLEAHRSLHDLVEAGIEVSRGPADRAPTMPGPAPIVVAGHEDLAAVQARHQREGVGDLAEREVADDPTPCRPVRPPRSSSR